MLKVENVNVSNMQNAIRAMRHPLQSYSKSDSKWTLMNEDDAELGYAPIYEFLIGPNDLDLARRLIKSGPEHRKFLRQIFVSMDIIAPLEWWPQFDTYKIGTTSNSTSRMHTIYKNEFEVSDFSTENLLFPSLSLLHQTIDLLNTYRNIYLEGGEIGTEIVEKHDKRVWRQLIDILPPTYNQMRTVTMNYEVARNIYFQRKGHKMSEWDTLCAELEALPYFRDFFLEDICSAF